MGLSALLAVAVEVRASERRVFRLSEDVGASGLTLARPAPFEVGQPVMIRFVLPGPVKVVPLTLRAEVGLTDRDGEGADGGRELAFIDPPREARAAIAAYVAGRLGLPAGTPWL